MKRRCLIILVFFMVFNPWTRQVLAGEKDHGAWWINVYGALSFEDHPLVPRVMDVFSRVLAASDKRANRFPNLVIIREAGDPWAICLRDGTILLTQKAMEYCYRKVESRVGDARIAFVLGHELAHLSKDDFWHIAAFENIQKFGSREKAAESLLTLLARTENIGQTALARDILKKKELQADAYGLLYAAMAGFDPQVIVGRDGSHFFKEWAKQITGDVSFSQGMHPHPDQRAAFLLSNIRDVRNNLDLYHMGVRLFQIGKYEDALDFLKAFNEKFPCREVYNNIGLVYFQMAMDELFRTNPEKAQRFRLSTMVDTRTRAHIYRAGHSKELFKKAARYFRVACEKDASYLPALVNHSSSLIMLEKYSKALALMDQAMEISVFSPAVVNNRAIAIYLLGPRIKVDMYKQASTLLKDTIEKDVTFPNAYYNLARLQIERKRNHAAQKTIKDFLNVEPTGFYAMIAAKSMAPKLQPTQAPKMIVPDFVRDIPVEIGELDKGKREKLKAFTRNELNLETVYGESFSRNGKMVLILENVVELIEQKTDFSVPDRFLKPGTSHRYFKAVSGVQTFVYDNFALDIKEGRVQTIVLF